MTERSVVDRLRPIGETWAEFQKHHSTVVTAVRARSKRGASSSLRSGPAQTVETSGEGPRG